MASTLFPVEPAFPPGFQYIDNFITVEEEALLAKEISALELHNMVFQGFVAHRKVASFGYDYSFDKRQLTRGNEIPNAFGSLIEKVAAFLAIPPADFEELLATEYPIGSVINWHRDAPPFHLIAGISLLADCSFRLRPYDKSRQGRQSIISFPVRRRSLYVIDGPARSEWEHSISPVKEPRYSITLRTLVKRD